MLSDKMKTRPVVLEVIGDVLFAQHRLPKGMYTGTQIISGTATGGGISWAAPTYSMRLPAERLEELGWASSKTLTFAALDVTAAVADGRMKVHC